MLLTLQNSQSHEGKEKKVRKRKAGESVFVQTRKGLWWIPEMRKGVASNEMLRRSLKTNSNGVV
jgi:hypothetical protein